MENVRDNCQHLVETSKLFLGKREQGHSDSMTVVLYKTFVQTIAVDVVTARGRCIHFLVFYTVTSD